MRNSPARLLPALALAVSALFLTQCASLRVANNSRSAKVFAGPSESLLLRVEPFDSVVKAELLRGGLDPVRFEEEFNTELRYRFSLRGQEEAVDSAGAEVILTVRFRHLQPGSGNKGTFGALHLETLRKGVAQRAEWDWRRPAKANVQPVYLARHMARLAAEEILGRVLATRPRPKEPVPPLQLL